MKLRLLPSLVQITEATKREREWLSRYLVAPGTPGRRGVPRGKPVCLVSYGFDGPDTFPAGLLALVERAARREGHGVVVEDARGPPPCTAGPMPNYIDRDYQVEGIEALLRMERGIVHAPTGAGKGRMIAGVTDVLPVRWIVITHRASITKQLAGVIREHTGEQVGLWASGKHTHDRVTCTTFQSAGRTGTWGGVTIQQLLRRADGLIIDEVHGAAAPSYSRVIAQCVNARWRFGFSATPLARGDSQGLRVIAAAGPVVYRVRYNELEDQGYLSKPKIRMVEHQHPKPAEGFDPMKSAPWRVVYGQSVVRNSARNATIVEVVKQAQKPCIVFVKDVQHGRKLALTIRDAGFRTAYVSGSRRVDSRASILRRLDDGDLDVCVATVVFQEGIDVPSLRSVVIASAGTSAIAAVQRAGRATRAADGKDGCEVWDIWDKGHALARQSGARKRAYEKEGFDVQVIRAQSNKQLTMV